MFPRAIVYLATLPLLAALPADDCADAIRRRKDAHRPKLSSLDNGTIAIGVDLNLGGAIAYLSKTGADDNIVNNWDWGRQIQMSHYSGPAPFKVPGKEPAKEWAQFPWNPVQAGDHFGHAAQLLDSKNDGRELYTKCIPKQWSLSDVPCECTFETRIALDGPTARVRCTLTAARTDKTPFPAFDQELPAVYANGTYHRLMSYTGVKPFTGGELTRVQKKEGESAGFPWARFHATERWAAQVNDAGWGLAIYQPHCVQFLGGFAGKPGAGGTKDAPTGYIAPVRSEHLDHNIAFEHEYTLILGTLEDIRKRANAIHGKPKLPAYDFAKNRQGWTMANATDRGWPLKGEWDVNPKAGSQLLGPVTFWRAEEAPLLKIDAAYTTDAKQARVFWAALEDTNFTDERSLSFPIVGDGEFRRMSVKLSDSPAYRGGLVRLRIDPGEKCEKVRIRTIALVAR